MKPAAACPELTQYKNLASGQLSSSEKEVVLDHLGRCQACVQQVEALLEKDTLVDLIRQARTLGEGPTGETVARLVERLRKLRPSTEAAPGAPAQIRLACSGCSKTLKVKSSLAGKKVKCPHCQAVIPVPNTLEPQGEESPRSSAPKGDSAGTQSDPGAGPTQPASKKLYDFLAPAQSPDELGRLGTYRVLKVLGAGGMGVVFQAEDPHLQRLVALKAMLPGLAASDSAKQRFLREARAAAALKHDHIVTIHQVGEDRGVPYLAMEFLEGETLDDRLKREGKLLLADVLRIGREMAEGLAAAHERGLIHRDIKPANVWLEARPGRKSREFRVKILDFGLARAATDQAHLTQSGAIVGTPAYMAPEQGQGKTVDPRSDLFSLGCVLYRMATGEAPFRGTDIMSTLRSVAIENPAPPVSLNPELPTELSDLVMQLLAKEPEDRPESAQAVADALQELCREVSPQPASPASISRPAAGQPAPKKKWPILAGVAGCLLLLVLAGLWAAGVFRVQTKDGTIALENVPADADVLVDGNKVTVKLADDGQVIEIKAPPGKRKLEIKAAGFKIETQEVTLAAGERKPISIRLVPRDAAAEKPGPPGTNKEKVDDAWLKEVAALPANKQAEAVAAKLKELNPGFDGKVEHKVEDGVVTEMQFVTDQVTDLSPVRALTGLRTLLCGGSAEGKGQLADLSPLKDMKLTSLQCAYTKVSDLSPLKDMRLTLLNFCATRVSGLSPLKDMRLTLLWCNNTRVSDLSPLKDMDLTDLRCDNTLVSELSPLKGMKTLRILDFGGTLVSELSPLKGMKTLTFLKCWGTPVSDLSPLKDMDLTELACDGTRVSDLSPLKGMQLTHLSCVGTRVSDLSPLKGMKTLRGLNLWNTPVSNLSPLKGMPLTHLNCTGTKVSDLSPLKGMPLTTLAIDTTPVADLSPLKGMKLETLNVYNTPVTDLSPLKDMKLRWLNLNAAQVTSAGLAPIQEMSSLRHVEIGGPKMTEDGLAHLNKLTDLESLYFNDSRLTEAGLRNLKGMTKLQVLVLFNTGLTDEDLVHLKGFLRLRVLSLAQTRVTDAGLEHLAGLKNLAELYLNGTAVTDKGVAKLKAALPRCNITR